MDFLEKDQQPENTPEEQEQATTEIEKEMSPEEKAEFDKKQAEAEKMKGEPTEAQKKISEKFTESLKDYMAVIQEELGIDKEDLDRIRITKAEDLEGEYKEVFDSMEDEDLGNVSIVAVPDDLWKGEKEFKSNSKEKMIFVKESAFKQSGGMSKTGWLKQGLSDCKGSVDAEPKQP